MTDENKIVGELLGDLPELYKRVEVGRVLVAAAMLEEMLTSGIKHQMVELTKIIEKRIFAGTGPLSNLSAKIDLAYSLGIIDTQTHKELHIVRDIRNKFAHTKDQYYFHTEIIVSKCNSLPARGEKDDPENRYMGAITHSFDSIINHMKTVKKPISPPALPGKSQLQSLRLNPAVGQTPKDE